jgi:hypothetical protein
VASSHSSWAQGEKTSPSVTLLGDPLKLKLDKQKTSAQVTIFNDSSQPYDDVQFSAVLRDSKGTAEKVDITPKEPVKTEPHSATPVDLSIDKSLFKGLSMPLKGFLVASGRQQVSGNEAPVASGTLPITLSEPKVLPANLFGLSPRAWVIVIPCIFALLYVAISSFMPIKNTVLDRTQLNLFSPLGTALTPSLKFGAGGSWASIVTVVGAILGHLLQQQFFRKNERISPRRR